ncbi:secreted/surface protein with fasciclin-like repeats [Belliella baltica DSM 15883]|uniref:Secreted/surface protein with fasciclin-like repeats n=1 Tax=Belliella baltica (strain DSM 15883 / CIP 108006 / LMG 21964 / BA134) TaxID=866536 RepID=I3Z2R5_BELBD|nr:secreted/surface protein with fasciclin-like repeats [Belliella baltica DSM 15883]
MIFPVAFLACNDVHDLPPSNEQLLIETAAERENLSLFVQAIDHSGLRQALSDQGPFTIFVPNDEAFLEALQFLGASSIQSIPRENLAALLVYHVIPGRVLSSQIASGEVDTFLENAVLNISRTGGNIVLNDSIQVITSNIEARNGMIHEIDRVLFPPSNSILDVIENNGFTTMLNAVLTAEIDEELAIGGPFTFFVPTNAAFTRFLNDNDLTASEFSAFPNLEDLLKIHLLEGVLPASGIEAGAYLSASEEPIFISLAPNGAIWINGNTRVTSTNLNADNGIVHVIDYVISSPQQSLSELILEFATAESPQFTYLYAALEKSGLAASLNRGFEDNVTLFAPTDEAFEALFIDLRVTGIEEIPAETLERILQYHLSPQRLFSQDLREDATLPTTLSGQTLNVNLAQLNINESGLISDFLNIHGQNGVLHGIDQVLIPED